MGLKLDRKKINMAFSSFMLSTTFVIIYFVWLYYSYGVFYLSNDDTGIMETYSGYSTGEPTAYHAYGSYTLGFFFKMLYTACPRFNWYSYGSILVVIISNAVIITCIYTWRKKEANRLRHVDFLLIGCLTIAINMYGISRISWTMNAVFAAVAGTMLLLTFLESVDREWLIYAMAVVFFVVSSLVRSGSYEAILPFALLAIIYRTARDIKRPCMSRKNLKAVLVCVLLMIPLMAVYGYSRVDSAIKQDMFPNGTSSFEHYRGLYTDSYHIPYEGNEEFYQGLGWDEEFYTMTGSWFFIDRRFNNENLKAIAEESARQQTEIVEESEGGFYWEEFKSVTVENPVRIAMTVSVILLFFVGIVLLFYSLIRKIAWQDWALLSGAQLLAMAEWGWLVIGRGRFIDRAFFCAALPALFVGLWIISKNAGVMDRHKVIYLFASFLVVWSMRLALERNISMESSEFARRSSQISADADHIAFEHPENLYIYDTSIAGDVSLFRDMSIAGCGRNRMLWGGTGVFSKPFYVTIGGFGYEEFYSENLFDEGVYYMTADDDVNNSFFMAYMRKTFGDDVTASVVEATDSGLYVYDMKR